MSKDDELSDSEEKILKFLSSDTGLEFVDSVLKITDKMAEDEALREKEEISITDDNIVELNRYRCDECKKRVELLVHAYGRQLCQNCSPPECWNDEAIDNWRNDDHFLHEDMEGPEELTDEEVDPELEGYGLKEEDLPSNFGETIGKMAVNMYLNPLLLAHAEGTIRGLEFRVAELEKDLADEKKISEDIEGTLHSMFFTVKKKEV